MAETIQFDISDESSVWNFIERGSREFGRIDGLFNVAADISPRNLGRDTDAVEIPVDVWQHTLDVNLTGFFYTIRQTVPKMLENGGGSIVTVDGDATTRP